MALFISSSLGGGSVVVGQTLEIRLIKELIFNGPIKVWGKHRVQFVSE